MMAVVKIEPPQVWVNTELSLFVMKDSGKAVYVRSADITELDVLNGKVAIRGLWPAAVALDEFKNGEGLDIVKTCGPPWKYWKEDVVARLTHCRIVAKSFPDLVVGPSMYGAEGPVTIEVLLDCDVELIVGE